MIRLEGTVTYADGRAERIVVTQAEYAAFELWALRHGIPAGPEQAPVMTMTRYLGYAATQRAAHLERDAWRSWDAWDGDVADVTLDAPEELEQVTAAAPPTLVDRSAG